MAVQFTVLYSIHSPFFQATTSKASLVFVKAFLLSLSLSLSLSSHSDSERVCLREKNVFYQKTSELTFSCSHNIEKSLGSTLLGLDSWQKSKLKKWCSFF